jgi:hypothetical protein
MDAPAKPSADGFIRQGITAFRAGDKETAAYLFSQAIKRDPESQLAWVWLFGCVTVEEERRHCLERAIAIDPTTKAGIRAQELLYKLPAPPAKQIVEQVAPQQDDPPPPPPPPPRKPKPKHKPKPKPVIVETVYEDEEEEEEDDVIEYRPYIKKNTSDKSKQGRKQALIWVGSFVGIVVLCGVFGVASIIAMGGQGKKVSQVFGSIDEGLGPAPLPTSLPQPTPPPQPTQVPVPTISPRERREKQLDKYFEDIDSYNYITDVIHGEDLDDLEDLSTSISLYKAAYRALLKVNPPPFAGDFHQDLLEFNRCWIAGLEDAQDAVHQNSSMEFQEAMDDMEFCLTLYPDRDDLIEAAGLSDDWSID